MSHFDYHPNRFQAQCILQDDFRCSIPVGLGPSSSSSSSSSIRASGLNSCTVNNLDSTSLGHLGQTVVEFRSFRKQNNIPELVLGKFARTLLFEGKHHGFLLPFSQDISTMGITGALLCRGGKARVASCPFVADFRCVGFEPNHPCNGTYNSGGTGKTSGLELAVARDLPGGAQRPMDHKGVDKWKEAR